MKFNYTVTQGKEIQQTQKPLSLNTKVDMQTRLSKALQKKQATNGAPAMDMPIQGEGFGRSN